MTLQANWSYPTTVKFGPGRIKELGEACLSLGIKNPLLVTDKILAQLDITQIALAILKSSGFEGLIFCEVDPNPNEVNLEAGLSAYRKGNHDGVVAFGGKYPVPVSFIIILITIPSLISVFKTAPLPLRHGSTTVTNGGVLYPNPPFTKSAARRLP